MADRRTDQRMIWLLARMTRFKESGMAAWDADVVDGFVEAFPEAAKGLKIYVLGATVCPMLNRTAARAHGRGLIAPGVIGNENARWFNKRTWSRYRSITPKGREELVKAARRKPDLTMRAPAS